jgi:hypothetical protein
VRWILDYSSQDIFETLSFFATRFLAGLRGFRGGAARLASRLVGGLAPEAHEVSLDG